MAHTADSIGIYFGTDTEVVDAAGDVVGHFADDRAAHFKAPVNSEVQTVTAYSRAVFFVPFFFAHRVGDQADDARFGVDLARVVVVERAFASAVSAGKDEGRDRKGYAFWQEEVGGYRGSRFGVVDDFFDGEVVSFDFPDCAGAEGSAGFGEVEDCAEDGAQFGGVGFPFFSSAGEGVADPLFGELYQFFPQVGHVLSLYFCVVGMSLCVHGVRLSGKKF